MLIHSFNQWLLEQMSATSRPWFDEHPLDVFKRNIKVHHFMDPDPGRQPRRHDGHHHVSPGVLSKERACDWN